MKGRRNQKNNTLFLLLFLVIIGIGIAYAVLTEQLTINNIVSYDAMKWDVGFSSAEDGVDAFVDAAIGYFEKAEGATLEEMGMTRNDFIVQVVGGDYYSFATSTATISEDKKSITVNCELDMTSKPQSCYVKAVITNNSTFNVALSEKPVAIYDDVYVDYFYMAWLEHDLYGFALEVGANQTLEPGETATVLINIDTRELNEDIIPTSELSIPVTIDLNFEEVDYSVRDLAMLIQYEYGIALWSDNYRDNIKNITFENEINIPSDAVESWDMSLTKDGRIMAYVVPNAIDASYYDLYIQSNEKMYANFDMSRWFCNCQNVDSINGLELLDTKFTFNMDYMFERTGYNSTVFTLDVSNFDTSNVVSMNSMFWSTGYNSTVFTLDVSGFDTSKVTDMSGMFFYTGHKSKQFVTAITIRNPNLTNYNIMFWETATTTGSQITVNYTSETSDLVEQLISTKTTGANVVKGVRVD